MDRLMNITPRSAVTFVPTVVTKSDRGKQDEQNDNASTRLLKLVPTETVAGYVPLISLAETITNDVHLQFALGCIAVLAGVVFTPLYLIGVGKPRHLFQWLNVVIATVAFVLWAYLLGGPFAMEPMKQYLWAYDKRVAGFVVALFTWGVAVIPYERLNPKRRAIAAHG